MKGRWVTIALLPLISTFTRAQGNTPQAALEELATTNKPEVIARHLPEPLEKSIDVLPRAAREQALNEILNLKKLHLDGCTVRRADEADTWQIIDKDGANKGKVKLANAFVSGVDAILPLLVETGDSSQTFIVTMHLEGHEWRIDDFGPWEKADLGLQKLVHEPTEMEKNDTAARETLAEIRRALATYVRINPENGYPSSLRPLTVPPKGAAAALHLFLDDSFNAEPLIKSGYQFRYVQTDAGDGTADEPGSFAITATPVEFGVSGSRNYFMDESGGIHSTTENRAATEDDPVEDRAEGRMQIVD